MSYQARDALRRCLGVLAEAPSTGRTFVAENGFGDGTVDMVRSQFPWVEFVANRHNPGYGTAANDLVVLSNAEFVLVMNADVELGAEDLGRLVEHLADHPRCALAAPRLRGHDGELQRTCYADPTVGELLWHESGLLGWRRTRGWHTFDHGSSVSAPWVLGAVMLIRRAAFRDVGGFDPSFFLYYEEVDLCRRFREAGWTVDFVASAEARHAGGASTQRLGGAAQRTLYRSLAHYHRKHGTASLAALRGAAVAIMGARTLRDGVFAVVGLAGRSGRRERFAAVGVWWAVLGEALRGWPEPLVRRLPALAGPVAGPVADSAAVPAVMSAAVSAAGSVGHGPKLDDQDRPGFGFDLGFDLGPDSGPRLDWLVTLPQVGLSPVVVMFGTADARVQARLQRHFDAALVVADPPGMVRADVVVVFASARVRLGDALGALGEDAVVYVEINRRAGHLMMTPRRLRRRFDRAGLTTIDQYWVLPSPLSPRRLVSFRPSAMRWYLQRLLVPNGWALRAGRRVLLRVPTLGQWCAPSHAIVAARRAGPPALLVAASEAGLPVALVDHPLVVTTSGYDAGSRAIVIPVPAAGPPQTLLKVSSTPQANQTTVDEHVRLGEVRADLPNDLLVSVPNPIGLTCWQGRMVGVESVLDGPTFDVLVRSGTHRVQRGCLDEVAEWLIRFQNAPASPGRVTGASVATGSPVRRIVVDGFERYRLLRPSAQVVHEAAQVALAHAGDALDIPTVPRHFDLAPWNLVRRGDGIGVLDWELSGSRIEARMGPPLCDLVYFVQYWTQIVSPPLEGGAVVPVDVIDLGATSSPSRSLGGAKADVQSVVRRYIGELGVEARCVPVLALYNWVEHVIARFERDAMLGQPSEPDAPVEMILRAYAEAMARLVTSWP